jgi:hypothetical protein
MVGSIVGLIVAAIMIVLVGLILLRQGRSKVLEQMLVETGFGPPEKFSGSLIVEDHRPGTYLRLAGNPSEPRGLQRAYRWFLGRGRRTPYHGVTFDRSSRTIELNKSDSCEIARFEQFLAVRMKEVPVAKSFMSIWLVELVPQKGKPIPIIDSPCGDRRASFENTAPLLKAISTVTGLPMQAWVAGNIWTPGWPPNIPSASD